MSSNSLENVDLDSLLLNFADVNNELLIAAQMNDPVSTLSNIEISRVSMETNATATLSTISTGNAQAKSESGLVVLDDDKGLV